MSRTGAILFGDMRSDMRRFCHHVAILRTMPQRMIDQHEREQRFSDRRRPDANARIMAAEGFDRR